MEYIGFFSFDCKMFHFFSGKIFGGDSDGIESKMRNVFNSHKDENSGMKKVWETKQIN